MNAEIEISKDEKTQQMIPCEWRHVFVEIVDAFRRGDFQLGERISGVRQLSHEDAKRISSYLDKYGAQLAPLPTDTWSTSMCQWMRGYWDTLIDLYTVEEGASDLVLAVRVYEGKDGYDFQIQSIHVP